MSVNSYTLGTEIRLTYAPESGLPADSMEFTYLQPDGSLATAAPVWNSEADELYWSVNIEPTQVGMHAYAWDGDDPGSAGGKLFYVVLSEAAAAQPPDLTDLRVLIPRTKRALLGVERAGHDALADEDVLGAIADAVAAVILVAPDAFGHTLVVAARDAIYGAPSAWKTSEEMSLEAQTVVVTQAALDYWSHELRAIKTQETIKDEAQEWSWAISAQALRDHLAFLRTERDRAIAALTTSQPALDQYASFLAVRDVRTSRLIEPWVDGVSVGGLETDPRFY